MKRLPTALELANGIEALHARIDSFSVQYDYQHTWDDAVEQAGRLNGSTLSGSFFYALKGDQRYWKSSSQGISTNGNKIRSRREVAFTGSETRTRLGKTKIQIQPGKHVDSGNAVSASIGWPTADWDFEQIRDDPGRAFFFPSLLRTGEWEITHSDEATVLAANEKSGIRVWLGLSAGPHPAYSNLVRCELDNPWPGIATQTRVLCDFQQVATGISLPRHICGESVTCDFDTQQPIGLRTCTITVSEYRVNDVSDELFAMATTDGDRIFRVA